MHHFLNLDLQLPKPFLTLFNGGAGHTAFHERIVLCPFNMSLLRSLIKLKSCVYNTGRSGFASTKTQKSIRYWQKIESK